MVIILIIIIFFEGFIILIEEIFSYMVILLSFYSSCSDGIHGLIMDANNFGSVPLPSISLR